MKAARNTQVIEIKGLPNLNANPFPPGILPRRGLLSAVLGMNSYLDANPLNPVWNAKNSENKGDSYLIANPHRALPAASLRPWPDAEARDD